ncbi:RNA polymerase sigma factor [Streptomyces sp. NPDC056400]|uniref:RNA polymerase sigma factor n=1 Tax=Streptomyces sp. NPDC056400 TaxID=3345808 RepID=UPI0035E00A5F
MVADGTSGEALLRRPPDTERRLEEIYPEYQHQAKLRLSKFSALSPTQREDVAQEAFINVSESLRLRGLDLGEKLLAYLLKAAENLAKDGLRRERVIPVDDELLDVLREQNTAWPEDTHDRRAELVEDAIEAMNEGRQRQVAELMMRGLESKEIAEELGISPDQVRVQRFRAVRELRQRLQDDVPARRPRETQQGEEGSGE